jgi:restriction endonuclease Mrr
LGYSANQTRSVGSSGDGGTTADFADRLGLEKVYEPTRGRQEIKAFYGAGNRANKGVHDVIHQAGPDFCRKSGSE